MQKNVIYSKKKMELINFLTQGHKLIMHHTLHNSCNSSFSQNSKKQPCKEVRTGNPIFMLTNTVYCMFPIGITLRGMVQKCSRIARNQKNRAEIKGLEIRASETLIASRNFNITERNLPTYWQCSVLFKFLSLHGNLLWFYRQEIWGFMVIRFVNELND